MSILTEHRGKVRMGLGVLGVSMIACCGWMPFMAIYEAFVGQFEAGSIGAGFIVFAIAGVLMVGLALRGWGHEARETDRRRKRHQRILEVARDLEGEVTVSELALETSYSLDEAEAHLDELAERGVAHLDVSAGEGRKRYTFPAFREGESTSDELEREIDDLLET